VAGKKAVEFAPALEKEHVAADKLATETGFPMPRRSASHRLETEALAFRAATRRVLSGCDFCFGRALRSHSTHTDLFSKLYPHQTTSFDDPSPTPTKSTLAGYRVLISFR
jgi:hypothetical protein